jgi:AcrR family transcriptional regulator
MSGDAVQLGLRERKRLAAMRRIQDVALRLFDEHGYQQVPIERVAAEADVSASSVYRYFGTKEQIVLWDQYDPVALGRIADEIRHHPPMVAVRRVVTEVFGEMLRQDEEQTRQRVRYMMEEPAIEAATARHINAAAEILTRLLADGIGSDRDELQIRLFAHAFVGATVGAMRHWYATGFEVSPVDIVDRMVTLFERGFTLLRLPPSQIGPAADREAPGAER